MKIITDDGTEITVTTRTETIALIRELVPDNRWGTKQGKHVAKVYCGRVIRFAYRFVDHGKIYQGPSRATADEAAEDYQRLLVRTPIAPPSLPVRSAETRARQAQARRDAYQRELAEKGVVRLGPPTCGKCQQIGHKASYCPASGWTKAIYVPKKKDRNHCGFCGANGHNIRRCQNRLAKIKQLVARAA